LSRVAGDEAKLTEATGAAETQRLPQNGRRTTTSFTGACVERERARGCVAEGATERGRGVSVCRLQKRLGARGVMAGKRADVGGSTTESAGGSRGTVSTGRAHGTERVGERTGSRADERGPWDRE
jgi:hypothetical protein